MSETGGSFTLNGVTIMGLSNFPPASWVAAQNTADSRWGQETAPLWLAAFAGRDFPPIKLKAEDEQQARRRFGGAGAQRAEDQPRRVPSRRR
jgi:hypothetical protein